MIREYTIQCVFVTLHSAVIMGGSMCTATMLKVMGRAGIGPGDNFTLWFVRNWGFALILISLLWAGWTISLERSRCDEFSKRNTVITGLVVLFGLAGFLVLTTIKAGSSLIRSVH
jgi:hypothetical protein